MTTDDILDSTVEITFRDLQWFYQMNARHCQDCKAETGNPPCDNCPLPAAKARLDAVRRAAVDRMKRHVDEDPLSLRDVVGICDTRDMTHAEIISMIPRRLYKYQSIKQHTLDGLRKHSLWFSSPEQFNDPFDCNVSCFIARNKRDFENRLEAYFGQAKDNAVVRTLDKSVTGWRKKNKIIMEIFRFFFSSRLHICCLSDSCDNVLMWSHYASQHQGMCLVFNSREAGLIRNNVVPVQYYDEYPSHLVDARRIDNLETLAKQLLAAKANAWSYEREWRAFMVNDGDGSSKGALREYEPSLLTGVVFGIKTSSSDIERVKQAIVEGKFPHPITLYQAQIIEDDFTMGVREIERM